MLRLAYSHDGRKPYEHQQPRKGEESGKCARCGEVQKREIPMTEHSFGKWETTKAATCTEEGESTRTCKGCGKTETQTIAKTEHTPSDWQIV